MGQYSSLFARPGFRPFAAAGAFAYSAPLVVNIVIAWAVAEAYPGSSQPVTFVALALVFLGLSATLPTLASAAFSGALADRWPRRRLMIAVNGVYIAAAALLVLDLLVRPTASVRAPGPAGFYLPLWVLFVYPLWAAITTASTIFRPAFNASLPRLVDAKDLGRANGLVYAIAIVLGVAASILATDLIALYGNLGVAFAMSVALVLGVGGQFALQAVPRDIDRRVERPPTSFLQDVTAGYRFLWGRRALLQLTLGALAVNFLNAMAFVQLALYATTWLGIANSQAYLYGVLLGGATLGAGFGTLVVNQLNFERRAGAMIIVLIVAQGLTVLGLGVFRSLPFALIDMFLFGMFPGMSQTIFLATVQGTVPDELLGRVFAADEVGSYALVPVGQAVGGTVTLAAGAVQLTFVVSGALTIAAGGILAAFRSLRRLAVAPSGGMPEPPIGAANPPAFEPGDVGPG
ncbi:MAG: MFS transporter [Thermoplasmata archaeon]|nr:MFS transporter [Thermoplasmata archaeon]